MDVKTRIMIDKITEYVRKEYKIIGPISDIESIVVSMGGIIVEKQQQMIFPIFGLENPVKSHLKSFFRQCKYLGLQKEEIS